MSAMRRRREEGVKAGTSGRLMRTIPMHLNRSQETIRADYPASSPTTQAARPGGESVRRAVEPVAYPNQRWARGSA